METKDRILTNKQMAEAFGGYDFRTDDMKKVCLTQDKVSFKAGGRKILDWLNRENTLKLKSLKDTTDWYKHCGLLITDEKWQAKLKELGI